MSDESAVFLFFSPIFTFVKAAFHDTDIDTDADILARILADTSDTRDFLARMSASVFVSMSASWNVAFTNQRYQRFGS